MSTYSADRLPSGGRPHRVLRLRRAVAGGLPRDRRAAWRRLGHPFPGSGDALADESLGHSPSPGRASGLHASAGDGWVGARLHAGLQSDGTRYIHRGLLPEHRLADDRTATAGAERSPARQLRPKANVGDVTGVAGERGPSAISISTRPPMRFACVRRPAPLRGQALDQGLIDGRVRVD